MAPPAIMNLDAYSDAQFRDIYGRHARHMAPSSNIINKMYHHVSGNTANVSAAEVVSIDASNQGQWDLLLGTSARRLDANTITTANTASWSANAMVTVRSANTTIRSANVIVGNLNATTITGNLTGAQSGITSLGSLSSLSVTGNATVGNISATSIVGTLVTAAQTNITSVGTLSSLSVTGNVAAGNITATAIGGTLSTAAQTNITSVGTLGSLNVTGNVAAGNLSGTAITGTLATAAQTNITSVGTLGSLSVTNGVTAATLTGVLQTASQPNITSVGTLSGLTTGSLTNNGATALNGSLVQSTGTSALRGLTVTQGLGVTGETTMTGNLSVTGNVSAAISNVTGSYKIGSTDVLTSSALGSGIASSSLTSVGTLTGLTVDGISKFGEVIIRTFDRTIPAGNTTVGLCDMANNGGTFMVELILIQSVDNNQHTKMYQVPVRGIGTAGAWNTLLPLSSTGGPDGNETTLQIRSSGNFGGPYNTSFRIAKLASSVGEITTGITVTMRLHQDLGSPVTITTTATTYSTDATLYNAYGGTLITQDMSKQVVGVGIGNPNVNYMLDVAGAINTSGGAVFANKYAIAYNSDNDSLVVLKNTGTAQSPNWVYTAVLAQS